MANEPIAHHVLDALEAGGVTEFIVACTEQMSDEVRACFEGRPGWRGRFVFIDQPAPLDLPGALTLAAPIVSEAPCIVHLASGLLDQPLAPLIKRLWTGSPDVTLIARSSDRHDDTLDLAGVWIFGPQALKRLTADRWPQVADIDASIVAERVRASGGRFCINLVDGWRRYRGDPVELLELNRIALDRLEPRRLTSLGQGNRIEGRVFIHERASVRDSVIVGPTVIGAGATINQAYIGPYTSIGPGARIEGAEIERSIIAPGASIMHLGGRLVASVVGRNARIFHDFSLPRAVRLRVGDGTEVALC